MLNTPEELHKALIDWIIAHGYPMGVFGHGGPGAHTDAARAGLFERGIKYDESTIGDLGGKEWCEDTYAEADMHPGLWAQVVGKHQRDDSTWFVPGETHTLTEIILDVLTATE